MSEPRIEKLEVRGNPRHYALLVMAWRWAGAHPRAYRETGGLSPWPDYYDYLREGHRTHYAVRDADGLYVSLITLEQYEPGRFNVHLTSRPQDRKAGFRLDPSVVAGAVYEVGTGCFALGALEISTLIPDGHRGSKRVALACGLTPDGTREGDYTRYRLTRAQWEAEHKRKEMAAAESC
ncbi:MAG TPA: hypothetical protein VD948_13010 [Rhodothermales bacterium]|nr:hypothetical protein [Rhodothermales bacterium]